MTIPPTDAETLRVFLEDPARPEGTLRYHELQGFLFTIASAPDLIRPSEWWPLVFGGGEVAYDSPEQLRTVSRQVMALYNAACGAVLDGTSALPTDCTFREDPLANFEDDAPIRQWSQGFLIGHHWLEELWDEYLPEERDEELGATLLALSFFSSREVAEAFRAETDVAVQPSLQEMAGTIREVFPDAIVEYEYLGRSIFQALQDAKARDREPRRVVKVGRNDPCPCGSEKKYKKCCGRTTTGRELSDSSQRPVVPDRNPEWVEFVRVEEGDDLIVSFAIHEEPGDVMSLILLRTPKYEGLLGVHERGVNVSHEKFPDNDDDRLKRAVLSRDSAVIETDRTRYELDVSRVRPADLKRARRILKRMNFDSCFELVLE